LNPPRHLSDESTRLSDAPIAAVLPPAAEAADAQSGVIEIPGRRAPRRFHATKQRVLELGGRGLGQLQRLLGTVSTRLPPTPFGALCGVADTWSLSAENLMLGYAQGLFAMDFDSKLRWHCPAERFVLYLSELQMSVNLRAELKSLDYTTSFDQAPRAVLDACGARREEGWLSERMKLAYLELFELGALQTVEVWKDGALVGGGFGVCVGRIWSAESMFERAPHAGDAQFAAVAAHLSERGFECVDGQTYSEHFARFGAREVSIAEYRSCLARGLAAPVHFHAEGRAPRDPKTLERRAAG
jgi:leucyl/phenylalanyl-tRNA--protein transferase